MPNLTKQGQKDDRRAVTQNVTIFAINNRQMEECRKKIQEIQEKQSKDIYDIRGKEPMKACKKFSELIEQRRNELKEFSDKNISQKFSIYIQGTTSFQITDQAKYFQKQSDLLIKQLELELKNAEIEKLYNEELNAFVESKFEKFEKFEGKNPQFFKQRERYREEIQELEKQISTSLQQSSSSSNQSQNGASRY